MARQALLGTGSARRQRLVPLSILWAELPSCGQKAMECDLKRQNTSGGEEQGVLRDMSTPAIKALG